MESSIQISNRQFMVHRNICARIRTKNDKKNAAKLLGYVDGLKIAGPFILIPRKENNNVEFDVVKTGDTLIERLEDCAVVSMPVLKTCIEN